METTRLQPITAEAFLIAEYERMRKENAELSAALMAAKDRSESRSGEGALSLTNEVVDCSRIDTNSSYYMFDVSDAKLKDATIEELNGIVAKSDDEIFEWGENFNLGNYRGNVFTVTRHRKFAGYIEFKEFDGTIRRYIDPRNFSSTFVVLDEPDTNSWVPDSMFDDVKHIAAEEIRGVLEERIEKLRKSEGVE